MRFFYPRSWRRVIAAAEVPLEHMPSGNAVRRATVSLDQAAMLWSRSAARARGPVARYISFDASPQHGQEIFVTVERLVERTALRSLTQNNRPALAGIRTLPISILGTGRMGLAEKTQAHLHQTWLDYGPAVKDVREACDSVLSILTDMGTEFGIADVADVVEEAVQLRPAQGQLESSALFPRAICIPGLQHLIDNVLVTSFEGQLWWSSFQTTSKIVAQWLHPITNRRYLRSQLPGPAQHLGVLFNKGCDRFAKWRWQTLAKVCADLLRLELAVRPAVAGIGSAHELKTRDNKFGAFLAAAKDSAFWKRVMWVYEVLQPLKKFAAWVRGCDCCEEQRLQNKKVDCLWQGCRASGLGQRLETALAELRTLREVMRGASPEADVVLTRMLHSLKLKMAWVSEEPALIWQAWDPSIAGRFIQQRDQLIEKGLQPHRVTELFAAPGQLRRDLERHAAGLGMSMTLRVELLAYSMAKIDDTWAETSHRDVSLFSTRCPASKVPYMAASHRMEQNLALYDGLSPGQQEHFCSMLKLHKSIGQRKGQQRVLRPRKIRRGVLDSFVYRSDEASTRDWEDLMSKETLQFLPVAKAARASAVTRLQREYLDHVLPEGVMLSLPAGAVSHGPAAASPGQVHSWFQIVHKRTHQQKRVQSASLMRQKHMRFQASWQGFLPWRRPADEAIEGQDLLVPDGDPEVVDLFDVADWIAWSTLLMRWRQASSGVPGCSTVKDGQLVTVKADWKDSSVPTWTVVNALADAGWVPGPAPDVHTLASAKQLGNMKDAVTTKSYLRCLLGLPELLKGDFTQLRSAQTNKYYDCVLRAVRPHTIPMGLSAKRYKAVLLAITNGQEEQLGQLESGIAAAAICDGIEIPLIMPKRKAANSGPAAASKCKRAKKAVLEDWNSLLCWRPADHAEQLNPIEDLETPGASSGGASLEPPADHGQAAPSAGKQEASPMQIDEPEAQPVERAASPKQDQEMSWASSAGDRLSILGCPVANDCHGALGQPGSYRRYKVKCPLHKGCHTSRSFSEKLAKPSGLGDQEPLVFIAVWLKRAADFDKPAHKAYKPTPAETVAYAKEVGVSRAEASA